ncbi:MAG: evbL [Actinomycetes bacterium]
MNTDELVAIACPKVRDLGWSYYFAPETFARGETLGLDGLSFYFMGRGGVLGDVESNVVTSAFGYFEPTLIDTMWTAGSNIVAPRVAGRAYVECAADFGRSRLANVDGLEAFCEAADAVNTAADPTGLALYSAAACEPFADDAPARAMQLLALLREFRGSAHLIALRVSGISASIANAIQRPDDLAMFGWDASQFDAITDADRAALVVAEALTERLARDAYATLDEAGRDAFMVGLNGIEAALSQPS